MNLRNLSVRHVSTDSSWMDITSPDLLVISQKPYHFFDMKCWWLSFKCHRSLLLHVYCVKGHINAEGLWQLPMLSTIVSQKWNNFNDFFSADVHITQSTQVCYFICMLGHETADSLWQLPMLSIVSLKWNSFNDIFLFRYTHYSSHKGLLLYMYVRSRNCR